MLVSFLGLNRFAPHGVPSKPKPEVEPPTCELHPTTVAQELLADLYRKFPHLATQQDTCESTGTVASDS
jgi:hypothetical protein